MLSAAVVIGPLRVKAPLPLRGLVTLGRYSAISYKRQFLSFFLLSYKPSFFEKGSKMQELVPKGSNVFPLRVDPFSDGRQNSDKSCLS